MFYSIRRISCYFLLMVIVILAITLQLVQAESFKVVQWWDKYVPQGGPSYRSLKPHSLRYQDLNGDNIYNDSVVWYEFSLAKSLNPLSAEGDTSPDHIVLTDPVLVSMVE